MPEDLLYVMDDHDVRHVRGHPVGVRVQRPLQHQHPQGYTVAKTAPVV